MNPSKILALSISFAIIISGLSVWYYFIFFLPWIENAKIELIKEQEEEKLNQIKEMEEKQKICIENARNRYSKLWDTSCEFHKSQIISCKSSIETTYNQCLKENEAEYERCKARVSIPGEYWEDSNTNNIKAYCWKKWCIKVVCDEYIEDNRKCRLPASIASSLESKNKQEISECKSSYPINEDASNISIENNININK